MARVRDTTPDSHAFPTRRYDLVKEFTVALGVVLLLVVILSAAFGSPDDPAITMKAWAAAQPNDVVATAASELDGSSTSAGYGPPYNTAADGQQLGPLQLQKWGGVTRPVDSANDLVIKPVSTLADPTVQAAVKQWNAADADQQGKWASAYTDALSKAPDNDPAKVEKGDYGPVPTIAEGELTLANSGALEGLLTTQDTFYGSDPTNALLLLADSGYLSSLADDQHLSGNQWGMMNETGNYPGQPWLWLYTFWYQIPPFNASPNADVQVWAIMIVLSLLLILVPWIPGLRSVPRLLRLHRLVWRGYRPDAPSGARRAG